MKVWVIESDTWPENRDVYGVASSPDACIAAILDFYKQSDPQNLCVEARGDDEYHVTVNVLCNYSDPVNSPRCNSALNCFPFELWEQPNEAEAKAKQRARYDAFGI